MIPSTLITVMTCPSLRPQYLRQTLEELEKAGASRHRRLVCSDGDIPDDLRVEIVNQGWGMAMKPDGPSGAKHMLWWILERFMESGADRLLFCEDDLQVSRDAVTKALAIEVPDDIGFVTYFDLKELDEGEQNGLHKVKIMGRRPTAGREGFWGTLMVLFPRRTVEYLLMKSADAWSRNSKWRNDKNAGDCVVSWALQHSPWKHYYIHVPTLVDHAGVISTTPSKANEWVRRGRNFIERRPAELQAWREDNDRLRAVLRYIVDCTHTGDACQSCKDAARSGLKVPPPNS